MIEFSKIPKSNRFAFNSYDSISEWHTTLDIIFIQRGTIDIKDMIIVEVNFDNNLYRKTTCIFWEIRKSIISLFRRTMCMSRQTMLRRTAKEMIHPQGTRNPMKRDAHETRWNERTTGCVRQRERRVGTKNGLCHDRGVSRNVWRVGERARKVRRNLSRRTALENCGFELACTISRCLLRPSARGVGRVEGSAIEIAGGPRGDCIQAHIESSPPWRQRAFGQSHVCIPPTSSPPPLWRAFQGEREGGLQGFGNRVVVAHGGVRRRRRWRQRKVQDDKDEGYAIFWPN